MLEAYWKSVIDQDLCAVVICDLQHRIIYMNPSAISRYAKRGGAALLGKSLLDCHNEHSGELIKQTVAWFAQSKEHNRVYTYHNPQENKDVYMIALRDESGALIGYYEKHEYRQAETASLYDFS